MLSGERHKVVVGDLVRADHFVGAYDSIFTAQIVGNKTMSWVREKSAEDAKGLVGRHAVAERRMGGNSRETQLRHRTGREVSDELFARLRGFFDEDALVELTATIAWENASSKFNRALRVPSQQLWKRR